MSAEDKQARAERRQARDSRRQRIAELFLQGKRNQEIAEAEGISRQQVSRDLLGVIKGWETAAAKTPLALRAVELQRLSQLARVAWLAWAESSAGGRIGDSGYLDVVLATIDSRCK